MKLRKIRPYEFDVDINGCFICTSHAENSKDGHIRVRSSTSQERWLLHRLIYKECFGEIPEGLVVRHKCDIPKCINPEHLELGTPNDNVSDRVIRGRSAVGERHARAKLKETDIIHIRYMYDWGLTGQDISKLYGVSDSTIYGVLNKKYWRHV
ncbi:Uncharacterised protein [Streptococcus pneumoniae]|nr:Uncharacterised protein [Streptococcus pneumoniae]